MKCSKCGSRDIDFQEQTGQSICVNCGTVLEESTIVSSIEFQEAGDRSHVVGQYISATCSKPYSGGRPIGRHGESRDPRDATLVNARRTITQVASSLRLSGLYIDRAFRLYQLALQRNFIFGRKQLHVVATCLYIICRQEKSPHLLIDFSDALQINVYVLGKSFLQFSRVLNLNLPVVDPSLYIHRYAARLDLGDSKESVVKTSLRIITRLKKDWIATGRRPDGICAVAMLVSARAHDFDVHQDVVCKLFRVSIELLRRRLEEFRCIPSAQLTLQQFYEHDMAVDYDPPSFISNIVNQRSGENDERSLKDSPAVVRLTFPTQSAKAKPVESNTAAVKREGDAEEEEDEADNNDDDDNVMNGLDKLEEDDVFNTTASTGRGGVTHTRKGTRIPTVKEESSSSSNNSSDADENSSEDGEYINYETQERFFKTKIDDIDIIVPIPGSRRRRRHGERYARKLHLKKVMYGEVYEEVREACVGQAWTAASATTTNTTVTTTALSVEAFESHPTESNGSLETNDNNSGKLRNLQKNLQLLQQEAELVKREDPIDCFIGENTTTTKKSRLNDNRVVLSVRPKNKRTKALTVAEADKVSVAKLSGTLNEDIAGIAAEDNAEDFDADDILGDEEDISRYLLTEEEQRVRTVIWEKSFRSFLDERSARRKAKEREQEQSGGNRGDRYTQSGKLRRKFARRAGNLVTGTGSATGATSQSGTGGLQPFHGHLQPSQNKSSKKINYEALKGLLGGDTAVGSARSVVESDLLPTAEVSDIIPNYEPIATVAAKKHRSGEPVGAMSASSAIGGAEGGNSGSSSSQRTKPMPIPKKPTIPSSSMAPKLSVGIRAGVFSPTVTSAAVTNTQITKMTTTAAPTATALAPTGTKDIFTASMKGVSGGSHRPNTSITTARDSVPNNKSKQQQQQQQETSNIGSKDKKSSHTKDQIEEDEEGDEGEEEEEEGYEEEEEDQLLYEGYGNDLGGNDDDFYDDEYY